MQNNLQIFENSDFGKLSVLMVDSKPHFPATECAKILGYKDPGKAIRQHCRWGAKRPVPHPQNPDKSIDINFIPEGDLYRLIVSSKLHSAEKFERWVFDVVLPTIRATGGFVQDDREEEFINKYFPNFEDETKLTMIHDLRNQNKKLRQTIEVQQPLVDFAEIVTESSDTITVEELAKIAFGEDIDIGRNRLYGWLREHKYLCGSNKPYQSYINKGWFKVAERIDISPSGKQRVYTQTLITGKGQVEIVDKLRSYNGAI